MNKLIKYTLFSILLGLLTALQTGCISKFTPIINATAISEMDFTRTYKTGEACELYIFNLFPVGNKTIFSAAKNGEIKSVKLVETEYRGYIFFSKMCTIVHGE